MQSDSSNKDSKPNRGSRPGGAPDDARYRFALEAANEGLWDYNAKTGVWFFSPRFYTMLGYEPGEFEPTFERWQRLLHPDDRTKATGKVSDCITGRAETCHTSFRLRAKSRSWRWIECRGRVMERDAEGSPSRVVGTHVDITEQRRMEEALRSSREMYRTLVEYQGEGVGFVDENEVFSFANRAAEQIFGLPPGQMIGRNLKEFTNADQFQKVVDQTRRRKSGHKDTYEMEFIRTDGERRYLLVTATPRFDKDGRYLGAFGIFLDITDRKRAENALREGEERYRLLIESLPLGVGILQDEEIVFANETAVRMLGYTHKDDLVNRDALEPLEPAERERIVETLADLRNGKTTEPVRYVTLARHRNGRQIPVEAVATRIVYQGRPALQICWMDLSEREQAEKDKARLEEQLRQARKLESIGRLAGGIAHDFNNLLTPIVGFSELSLLSLPAADPLRSDMEHIYDAGKKAQALTQQLLAFGRKQMLRVEVLDINEIVGAAHSMLRRLIRESVEIDLELEPAGGRVRADPTQVQQILLNLALNARDAMAGGGRMVIRTGNATLDESDLDTDTEAKPGPYVVLSVADTGRGMDEETQSRIFEPFFTTKPRGVGTGLGLSIARRIVDQHGGVLGVKSEVGKGTTFRVELPLT